MAKRSFDERSLHDFAISRTALKTIDQLEAALECSRNLVTEDRGVEAVRGAEVTANAFTLMGTPALLDRTLMARDERAAEPLVAVIGERPGRAGSTAIRRCSAAP